MFSWIPSEQLDKSEPNFVEAEMQVIEARVELETPVNGLSTLDWRHLSKPIGLYIFIHLYKFSDQWNEAQLLETFPFPQRRQIDANWPNYAKSWVGKGAVNVIFNNHFASFFAAQPTEFLFICCWVLG